MMAVADAGLRPLRAVYPAVALPCILRHD